MTSSGKLNKKTVSKGTASSKGKLALISLSTLAALTLTASQAPKLFPKPILEHTKYTVISVIDGDTFDTKENQRIRINGIEAPEKGLCGADIATETLKKIIHDKSVYLKIVYLDTYRRMVADVYTEDGTLVAETLARGGLALVEQKAEVNQTLVEAGKEARAKKKGIFSETCTQMENTERPNCAIKGNRDMQKQTAIYFTSECRLYNLTIIQKYQGDEWFCSEKEAVGAGYKKAENCY